MKQPLCGDEVSSSPSHHNHCHIQHKYHFDLIGLEENIYCS